VIAMPHRYDAKSGQTRQACGASPSRGPRGGARTGHCEGPQRQTARCWSACGARPPNRPRIDRYGLKGTLKVFGRAGRGAADQRGHYFFVRDGWSTDVDVRVCGSHRTGPAVGYGLIQSALISATSRFPTARTLMLASGGPGKGRDGPGRRRVG